ncbi:medium-chain acyl-CoA ligase ACSF2, mitochondrial isoform X2 [Eucyclogobius newberryi]|uniref:medium-chain acyl-CoA ligase ACSF2, mitochondrial isoform X2 n=1 Tax=Eucyclogobius newberryi TaxID=166745 RepID=UPI003B5A6A97
MMPKVAFCSQTLRNLSPLSKNRNVFWRQWTRHPAAAAAAAAALPARSRYIHVDSPPLIPTLTTSYAHGTSSVSLLHATIPEVLLSTVERVPDREAVAFLKDGVRKTFAQFQEDVDQAAAGLLAIGLKKGDRLGMWGPNIYEWVLFQFATAKAGIILVSVNPAYQVREVEQALRKVSCNAIVCPTQFVTQKYCGMLREICPELDTSVPGNLKSKRLPDLHSVIVLDSRQPGTFHFDDIMQAGDSRYKQELQDLQKKLCFDDPINIQFTSGTTGAPKGATLSHRNIINDAYYVGRRFGYHWKIGYGTTENSPVTFCGTPLDSMERKCETAGYILDHVEAKVVNPTSGQMVPLGELGEVMIRGFCVMLEYWNDEAKTAECISKDGWYKTGDIGRLDAYSYLRIEGRIKDMLIRGGENIYPAEIEQFLHTHPKVKEAQVVGVKDERMGEEVCACIKLVDGQECTPEEIKTFCKNNISHYKIPRYVLFVTSYPLTITGKIQKNKLREVAEEQLKLK